MNIVRIKDDHFNYTLSAKLAGDLTVSGHDLSKGLEEMLGTDEYEYWYIVRAADVPRVSFAVGDAADWQPARDVDVVVSNAALQWIPRHQELMAKWASALPCGESAARMRWRCSRLMTLSCWSGHV